MANHDATGKYVYTPDGCECVSLASPGVIGRNLVVVNNRRGTRLIWFMWRLKPACVNLVEFQPVLVHNYSLPVW